MTFGLSRDDVEARLLPRYRSLGLIDDNPFEVLDQVAVGTLISTAISDARNEKPSINIGVCGEHAGEPRSIAFLIGAGCTSLSCSPYRVPVTRLVAAQTVLQSGSTVVSGESFFRGASATANAPTESPQTKQLTEELTSSRSPTSMSFVCCACEDSQRATGFGRVSVSTLPKLSSVSSPTSR